MVPVIALVGRPNVGKSTLFNRLTKSRDAIVADVSGLTRDRQYGEAVWQGKPYIVVDTGGITGDEQGLDMIMAGQSLQAIEEADAVLFLVDARAGRTGGDELIAEHLRKRNKHTYLIANKIDGADPDAILGEFSQLGLGHPIGIAAAHGRNINPMLDAVLNDEGLQAAGTAMVVEPIGTKIAIIGRPNVGKSTLVNRMLGEDRVVVFDQAGTTRDSIYIPYERYEKPYTLIDTAGVRRRGKVFEAIEKFSVIKTLQAIKDANVVIFVVDAREGIVEQDLHLLGFVLESGRALVIAVNKWDGMENEEKEFVKTELQRRLIFAQFADLHFISALHGSGVGLLYKSVDKAFERSMVVGSSCVTRIWVAPIRRSLLFTVIRWIRFRVHTPAIWRIPTVRCSSWPVRRFG